PLVRAIAADAVGRSAAPADAGARARRLGALLEVMAGDRYPAVRHLAWRSARRLTRAARADRDYDPSAPPDAPAAALARLAAELGAAAVPPDAGRVAALRARSPAGDLDIGE